MNIQFGVLVTIISAALMCGGFYYTTQLRLDTLEDRVNVLSKKIKKIPAKKIGKRGSGR